MRISIPKGPEGELHIDAEPGDVVFVLGANGCGKSHLLKHIARQLPQKAKRLAAYRQNFLMSDGPEMTAAQRQQLEGTLRGTEQRAESAWRDQYASQRLSSIIFDLIELENRRNRRIA